MTYWLLALLLGMQAIPKPTDPATSIDGAFTFMKGVDPLTDEESSSISTIGEGGTILLFKCSGKHLGAGFHLGKYFRGKGSSSSVEVERRFPPEPVVPRELWSLGGDQRTLIWPRDLLDAFIEKAKSAPSVILRATDVDGQTVTATFQLNGFSSAFAKLPCASSENRKERVR